MKVVLKIDEEKRLVLVAFVVVEFVPVRLVIVDEALTTEPATLAKTVEVIC